MSEQVPEEVEAPDIILVDDSVGSQEHIIDLLLMVLGILIAVVTNIGEM